MRKQFIADMLKRLKEYRYILVLVLIFGAVQSYSLAIPHDIWWDSSVYIGMGKYLFSLGESGLWEPSRPLVWPILLGAFWKIGISPIVAGKVLLILVSCGSLMLTYLIAARIFDRSVGYLSMLLLAFSQTFFLYASVLQTEIPSLFFTLLSIYLILNKDYLLSGVMLGLALMTRFFSAFVFIPLLLFILWQTKKNQGRWKPVASFFISLSAVIIPYLIANFFIYSGDLFYPFLLQANMVSTTGWVFAQPFNYYFVGLWKESILVVFTVASLSLKHKKGFLPVLICLFVLIPFSLISHKEMRFLLMMLPFLFMLSAHGFLSALNRFGKPFITVVFFFSLLVQIPQLRFNSYDGPFEIYNEYMQESKVEGSIWISNPAYIVNTDYRAELLYYPTFDNVQIKKLSEQLNRPAHILINTCDTPCPLWELTCEYNKNLFINTLKEKYRLARYKKVWDCDLYIFTS